MWRPIDRLALKAFLLTAGLPLFALLAIAAAAGAGLATGEEVLAGVFGLLAVVACLPGLQALPPLVRPRDAVAVGEPAGDPALLQLVADQAAKLGVAAPEVKLTLEPGVWVAASAGRPLIAGAPSLYGASTGAARVAVTQALMAEADALARLLDDRVAPALTRADAWTGMPLAGALWSRLVRAVWRRLAEAKRAHLLLLDAECARLHGPAAVAAHVRAQVRGALFEDYWAGEVVPCLDAGFRPPVLDGWRRFLADPLVAEHVSELLAGSVDDDPDALYAPPAARLAALPAAPEDQEAAFVPLMPVAQLERQVLGARGRDLVEIQRDRLLEAVWMPMLERTAQPAAHALAGWTVADLPRLAGELPSEALGAALALALAADGWSLSVVPGGALRAEHEEFSVVPQWVPAELADGDDDGWEQFAEAAGVRELPLAPPVPAGDLAAIPTRPVQAAVGLPRTRRLRRMTAAALAVVVPLGGGLCVVTVAMAVGSPAGGARTFFVVVAPLATLALMWWLVSRARIAFSRGRVVVAGGEVRVEDRALLREPLVVARERIRAVAVDEGAAVSVAGGPLRFPYAESPWQHPLGEDAGAAGWLWSGPHANSVPLIGAGDELPNLLLLFEEPVAVPRMRLRGDGLPRGGDRLRALALRVDDAASVREAFGSWGLLRPITPGDATPGAVPAPPVVAKRSPRRGGRPRRVRGDPVHAAPGRVRQLDLTERARGPRPG